MSERNDMEYFEGRASRERELARTSASDAIARIHTEMAEHYEKLIAASETEQSPTNAS